MPARSVLFEATALMLLLANETCTGFLEHSPVVGRKASWSRRGLASSLQARRRDDDADGFIDDDDDDDDDDDPPAVDVSRFKPPTTSFGLNKGRSSPSQRKAMGRSGSETARVHICTTCGSEFVKWMGRCPTCKEWNTLQEHVVVREQAPPARSSSSSLESILSSAAGGGSPPRPLFGGGGAAAANSGTRHYSWLDGIDGVGGTDGGDYFTTALGNAPIRVTDLYKRLSPPSDEENGSSSSSGRRGPPQRIWIPGDEELNTVLGGGIMQGSITLIGGDPGVGKSTLLLQMAASVASLATPTPGIGMGPAAATTKTTTGDNNHSMDLGPVWYVSGEENPDQIAARAERLGIQESELWLLSETHADSLCEQVVSHYFGAQQQAGGDRDRSGNDYDDDNDDDTLSARQQGAAPRPKPPSLIIIDSIQTIVCNSGGASAAGGVTQVRECVALFLRLAKSTRIPIFLVGHVTRSGDVAGPRTVEHMVDCVLYLEGLMDQGATNLRMLRASKNRFGSADEVGVYEMTVGRLLPVSDPSSLFLAHRSSEEDSDGCAIAIVLEGMRAMTVEIQALVVPLVGDGNGYGRRTVDGIAQSRLLLLLGVLQKRGGIMIGRQDVYVNVVGRMRLDRTEGNAGDLAVAVALVSSLLSIPVRADTAFVGAVDLSGKLREVQAVEKRLHEARRMGFSRVVSARRRQRQSGPKGRKSASTPRSLPSPVSGVEWIQCESLVDAINAGLVKNLPKRRFRKTKRATPKGSSPPERLQDLGLEIMDDDEDDELDSFA